MPEVALSFAACLLFAVLAAHFLLKRSSPENAIVAAVLFVFCLVEAGGSLVAIGHSAFERPMLIAESLLPAALMFFGINYGRTGGRHPFRWPWVLFASLALLFPVAAVLFPFKAFFRERGLYMMTLPLGWAGNFFYFGTIFYSILALASLEATFKAAPPEARREIKSEAIGFGAILFMLIFYYSQGLLYHVINMNLEPARSGVFIISSLLILYSRLFHGKSARIKVSRYILYRSVSALVVGGYLVGLGLIGEGIRYFGITFGEGAEVFAVFAAGILVAFLFLSKRFRMEVKVFVIKNFLASKHDYRTVWLDFTGWLAKCRTIGQVENATLSIFIDTFFLKGAALYYNSPDRDAHVFSAGRGITTAKELRISSGLLSYLLDKKRVLDPADGEYLPTGEEGAFFKGVGRCLLVPLAANGDLEGFILLGREGSREKLIYEDFDLMKNLAKQASLALRMFRLSEELAQARSMAAVTKMTSFVVHDLKNMASSLSLLVENSGEHISDPDFQGDMVLTTQKTLSKMLELIRRLRSVPGELVLNAQPTDLYELVRETVAEIPKAKGRAFLSGDGTGAVSMADREEMKKVVINLLFNSMEATGAEGNICVETGRDGNDVFIRTRDEGCGMSEEFIRTGLFRPFTTTKEKGLGIGLFQCKQIIEAHGGRIEVESEPGKGSVFTVYLPALEYGPVLS
ncbi:MAG: PEP-CTERM system histidine kinase PrsK [Nitrospiraceae bacterium]|nr:PEP-CTERM system histidine kinase PrsK [Nitrospiraceae bacterium]